MMRHVTERIHLLLVPAMLLLASVIAGAQVIITSPAEGTVSALRNQAVIGQAPSGLPIRLDINGVPVDSATVRPDGAFEFLGVQTPEGPVRYTVTVRMRNGKTFAAGRSIHVLGAPRSIVPQPEATEIPADGTTVIHVTAKVVDNWGEAIPEGYFVTIAADSLKVIAEDGDPTTPGMQVPLKEGAIRFALRASTEAGPAELRLSTNGITATQQLYLTTPKQPFMLIGSVSATGSLLEATGPTGEFSHVNDIREGLHTKGRIAVTGRGTVLEHYLLTLSIDSDRRLNDQLFRSFDPSLLYSLYGDNGTVSYEAQSASPIFAKIERNQSHLMYGDFNTSVSGSEFAAYNRTFTGGKLHLETTDFRADAFGTVTNRKVVQEEIRGRGISGYYFLQNGNIVTGSEKVRIEVRDRFHSERVISSHDRSRFSDYDIDYTQGSLYFKQPVSSLDDQNNPVYIVVSSEAITDRASNFVVGGASQVKLFDMLTLGASSVVEQQSPSNYMLLGGNAGLQFNDLGSLQGEIARSSDALNQGYAWKVEGQLNLFRKAISIRPYYRRVDGTFINPTQSGSGSELGTTKYGGNVDIQPMAGTMLSGDFYQQNQLTGIESTKIRSLTGSIGQSLWSGSTFTMKIEDVTFDGPDPDPTKPQLRTHSTLLSGRLDATLLKGLTANALYERNLRPQETQAKPNALGVGLEYQILSSVAIFAQQKFLEQEGQLTNVGIRTKLGENTSLYGEYETGSTASGQQNAASIGLKNTLKLTDEITCNLLFEKTKNLSRNLAEARTPDHDALSLALEYLPSFPLKATAKGEYNGDRENTRMSFTYGVDCRLLKDVSFLAEGRYYSERSMQQPGLNLQGDYIFGFACRPLATNWLNLIGRVEVKYNDNEIVQPVTRYSATILSSHAYVEPLDGVEIGVKYALKGATDYYDSMATSTLTDYAQLRSEYDLTTFMNIAVEGRLLRQHEAGDMKFGYSAELGFTLLKNTMVVAGYNFQGYGERDLVDPVYAVRGPYVTMRMKFTEGLFGLNETK
jgi:hypothetical protein